VRALKLSDGAVEWETLLSDEVAATCRECAALAKERLVVLTSDLVLAAKINGQQWPEQMDLRRNKKRPGVGLLGRSGCQVS